MDPDSKKNAKPTRGSTTVTQPTHTEVSEGLAERELPPEGYEHAKFPVESSQPTDAPEPIAGEQPPVENLDAGRPKEPKSADPKAAAEAEEAKRFAAYEAKQKRKEAESGDKTADAKPKASNASSGTVTSGVQHPPSAAAVPEPTVAPAKTAVPEPKPEPEVDPAAAQRERAARLAAVERMAREDEEKRNKPERDKQQIAENHRQHRESVERLTQLEKDRYESQFKGPTPKSDAASQGGVESEASFIKRQLYVDQKGDFHVRSNVEGRTADELRRAADLARKRNRQALNQIASIDAREAREVRDGDRQDRSESVRNEEGSRPGSSESSASKGLEPPAGLLSATSDADEQATLREAWANVVALDKGYAKDLSRNRSALSDFAQQVLSETRASSHRAQPASSAGDSGQSGFESFKQAALAKRRKQFERESPEQAYEIFTTPVLMDDWESAQIEEIEMEYALGMSRLGD